MYENSNVLSCVVLDRNPEDLKCISDILNDYSFINVLRSFDEILDAVAFLSLTEPTFLVIDSRQLLENDNYRIIQKIFPSNKVIVTAESDEDFIKIFELGDYHFLNKPLIRPSLISVIRSIYRHELSGKTGSAADADLKQSEKNGLFVKGDAGYVRVDFDQIDYIKAFGEYSKLYKDQKWTLLSCTLKRITELLPKKAFSRVHRSFTVRIGSISGFDAHEIRIGDEYVPIGRNYKKDFESSLLTLT